MDYHLAFKKKKSPSYAATWMNLEDIMLGEMSQSQGDNTTCFHLYKASMQSNS